MDDSPAPSNPALGGRIDAILRALSEPDQARREAELAGHLSPRFTVIRPDIVADGVAGLCEAYAAVRHELSAVSVVRTSAVQAHHDHFYYRWAMVEAGSQVAAGSDFGWTDEAGRLVQLVSFPGRLPPGR